MKYILILLFCACTFSANCQTLKRDAKGNYHKAKTVKGDVKTKYTLTEKDGSVYPIWISARGNHYYFKRSKNGNIYKVYLPEAD